MGQLYDVSFTTKKQIIRFNSKGKEESRSDMETPVKLTALPLSTAKSYEGCDNYTRTIHVQSAPTRKKTKKNNDWANPATKPVHQTRSDSAPKKRKKHDGKTKIQRAAETGDLTEAINATAQ